MSTVTAESEMMMEEELHLLPKAGDGEAGGARCSEVRRDGPQGVFGSAMDVHVLKTGT